MRNHQRIAAGFWVLATGLFPSAAAGQNLLNISPELVQASSTSVGVTGYPQNITITNESANPVTIEDIAISGGNASDFAFTSACPQPPAQLPAWNQCTLSLTMTPTATGTRISGMTFTPLGGPAQSVVLIGQSEAASKSISTPVASLTFPVVAVGLPDTALPVGQVTLQNTGNAPVTIQSVSITGANPGDFILQDGSSACPSTLAPEEPCYLTVSFQPLAAGIRTAALTVASDATSGTMSVPLSGEGAAPFIQLQVPGLIDFSNVTLGSLGQAYMTLNNSGSENITISRIQIIGANASDFSTSQNPCPVLAPQSSCPVPLNFTPAATGLRIATAVVTDTAPGSPHTIPLEGIGNSQIPQIQWANVTGLNFGLPQINANPTLGFAFTNTGNVNADIAFQLQGTNAADFYIQSSCNTTMVNPNEVCDGSVTFTPAAGEAGERVAYLVATDSTGGQSIYLPMLGSAPGASAALSSNAGAFGPQLLGTSSTPGLFTLTNPIQVPVTITGWSIAGSAATDFQILPNGCAPGTVVPPQGSCQYDVTFTPSAVGLRTGVLLVTYQGASSALQIPLLGTGAPTHSSVSFDQTSLFQFAGTLGDPVTQQVTLRNTGSTLVNLLKFSISGTAASDYTITNNYCASGFPSGFGVNDECSITLQFTPSTVGLRPAVLQVYDTASGSPQNVSLLGAGSNGAPVLVYDKFLNFNAETLGSSNHQTIGLSGSLTGNITFSSVAITGPNASDFSLVNGCPTTIPAQPPVTGECNLTVTFTPSVTGPRFAQVQLTDNAAGSPQVIPISGVGLVAERAVSFFPSILSFPEFQGVGYATNETLQISNTGTVPVTFTGFQISGPAASDFSIVSNTCKTLTESCHIVMSFTPSVTGFRTASLYFADNAAQSPQSIVLAGVGFPASSAILVSPQALAFGSTLVGVQSTDYPSVQIANTGNVPITIQSASLSGSSDFSTWTDGCAATPFPLVPGGYCSLFFQFTPSATGPRTAAFTVSSTATNGPQTVTLSGTGQ